MDRTSSRAPGGVIAQSRAQGRGSAGAAAEDPQWYVISEDSSLSLRVVSGAILCEGEDGELVVSPELAAHAARFDIIDDELWLSCLSGRIRVDGRPVTSHHRVAPGAQIHIGKTRYFVAGEINEAAPDVPVLDNALAPGDSRLPKPSERHLPVFYSRPLEIEEIIITESAEPGGSPDAAESTSATSVRSPTPGTGGTRPSPERTPGSQRGRMTSLLIAGLLASATLAGWHVIPGAETRRSLAIFDTSAQWLSDPAKPAVALVHEPPLMPSQPVGTDEDDPVIDTLAYLAWADEITDANHARFVATAGSLGPAVLNGAVREHVEHYVKRLIADVTDADRFEDMVMSLGPVLAPYPAYRAALASLEKRVSELSRWPDRQPSGHTADLRVAAVDGTAGSRRLE